jgi:Fe-S oxidoreductase
MALPVGDVVGILGDNLRLRGSVLPLSRRNATGWSRGLDLPRGGDTVLYTGLMYQLVPGIEALVALEERLGRSRLAGLTGLGRRVNRVVNVSAPVVLAARRKRAPYEAILRDVAVLLREAGVRFGYLYEDDLYSGALAWDLGLDDVVARHAQRVAETFRRHGVKTAITVDPHTTNMLRSVYPELLGGFDVEVRSYLELLEELEPEVRSPLEGEVVIHDSCVYARYEDVVDEPRKLLARAGLSLRDPAHARRRTWCCGGPVEALYPEKALAQATRRVEELREAAPACVTMCPLCLVNLQRAAGGSMPLRDVSHYLLAAYGSPAGAGAAVVTGRDAAA